MVSINLLKDSFAYLFCEFLTISNLKFIYNI
jgi:hypothetical protein